MRVNDGIYLDGTPLLDIKPYVPEFDTRAEVRTGWYATRSKESGMPICASHLRE